MVIWTPLLLGVCVMFDCRRSSDFFDLYRINVVSGRSELLCENHDYVGLVTDSTFRLRL
jgi:hypothetical protein